MANNATRTNMQSGVWWATFLDAVGDLTGSIEQAVNGSITPVNFLYTVPDGYVFYVSRIIIAIQDTGKFDADKYGNGLTLTNGVVIGTLLDGGAVVNATAQLPIRANSDWASYAYDLTFHAEGVGDDIAVASYSFQEDGLPLAINGGNAFLMQIRDDLTGLTRQHARVAGVLVKKDRSAPTPAYLNTI